LIQILLIIFINNRDYVEVRLVLAHLFVKVPRLGDSKETFSVFESSCYLLLTV